MRKTRLSTLIVIALFSLALVLSSCAANDAGSTAVPSASQSAAAASESASAAPASASATGSTTASAAEDFSGKTLTVANWKGYGSDADYGAAAFEKLYNCKVVHQYYTSEEEMLTMLRTGGLGKIDVFLPNSQYIKTAQTEGLLQPIDVSKVSTYKDLMESLTSFKDAKGANGEVYAVPWTWGTTSLGYNTDTIKDELNSWSSLWDPKYAGKVGLFDDYSTEIMITALYLGEDPYNPDLTKVKDALMKLKGNSKTLWASYDDFIKPYTAGEVVIGNMWTGIASQLKTAGQPVAYVYPKEGTIGWTDFWCVAKDAPNYDLACKWIDFMTNKDFQTAFATDKNAHCPTNNTVLNSLTDDQKKTLWIYPEAPKNIVLQSSMDQQTQQAWVDLWNDVKAS